MIDFDTVFATKGAPYLSLIPIIEILKYWISVHLDIHPLQSDILHETAILTQIRGFCVFDTVFATAFCLMPGKTPAQYALCKIRKGKRWFVEFAAWDAENQCLKKKRIFCPAKFETTKQKNIWASEISKEINELLIKGYQFSDKKPDQPTETPKAESIRDLVSLSIAHKKAVLKKKSFSTYSGILQAFIQWLGSVAYSPISELRQNHISDYQDFLLGKGLTTVTVNNKINVIVTVFKHLEKRGHIEKKPVNFHRLPTTENFRNRAFSPDHRQKLEKVLREKFPGLFIFTRIMYYQFIRPGEIIALRIWDFSLERNTITVSGGSAKNRKMETLPLHPSLKTLVAEKCQFPGAFYITGKYLNTGPIPAGVNTATEMHAEALKLAGLENEGYTLYSWKHTGVIAAYNAGMDLIRLQHLLRHNSVTTTEIYLKSLRLLVDQIVLKEW